MTTRVEACRATLLLGHLITEEGGWQVRVKPVLVPDHLRYRPERQHRRGSPSWAPSAPQDLAVSSPGLHRGRAILKGIISSNRRGFADAALPCLFLGKGSVILRKEFLVKP